MGEGARGLRLRVQHGTGRGAAVTKAADPRARRETVCLCGQTCISGRQAGCNKWLQQSMASFRA